MLNKVVAKTYQIQSKNSNFRREMDKRHSSEYYWNPSIMS